MTFEDTIVSAQVKFDPLGQRFCVFIRRDVHVALDIAGPRATCAHAPVPHHWKLRVVLTAFVGAECCDAARQAVAARVPEDRSFLGPLVAGMGAGLAASLIRVPTEVVKQRMQSGACAVESDTSCRISAN